MLESIAGWSQSVFALGVVLVYALSGPFAALHAVLNKRDPRSAMGWLIVCLFLPLIGALTYWFFGINRIASRAMKLRTVSTAPPNPGQALVLPRSQGRYQTLTDDVIGSPLTHAAKLTALHNGDEAYPAMLAAIDQAEATVFLSTYIFDTDALGRLFVQHLAAAQQRGVDVRVLVDGVGEMYSWPRVSRLLRSEGVLVARYLPPRLLPPSIYLNLRNHRKLLIVDGNIAFTGGMNISAKNIQGSGLARLRRLGLTGRLPQRRPIVTDVHFSLEGPVALSLQQVFLGDWGFARGLREVAQAPAPQLLPEASNPIVVRTVADGPSHGSDLMLGVIRGAVAAAQHSVAIMTPYFVHHADLLSCLQSAAQRGVQVRVVLPAANNLAYVHWASRHMLPNLLRWGVEVFYQPAPFAHSKLLIVDRRYGLIGSANLDARSLRLNFEVGLEIFDSDIAADLDDFVAHTVARSERLELETLTGRSLPVRIRDGIAWLFSPYL